MASIATTSRIREALVGQRTAKANQIRGLVGEYGLVAPLGLSTLRRAIPEWLEAAENGLSAMFRALLSDLAEDLRRLDDRVKTLDEQISQQVRRSCGTPITAAARCRSTHGQRFGRCAG